MMERKMKKEKKNNNNRNPSSRSKTDSNDSQICLRRSPIISRIGQIVLIGNVLQRGKNRVAVEHVKGR
jgi:hypothetical protein